MELSDLIEAGRPSRVLCRLAQEAFTGLVFVERGDRTVIFTLVEGVVAFAEDPDQEGLFADELFQRGQITSKQFTDVMEVVNETLSDNEDHAFCAVAVEQGVLTSAQVSSEMSRRVRGLVIQALGWDGCKIEVDDDLTPDEVNASYPQALGPLLYMSVRTFYEHAEVSALLGDTDNLYMRLAGTAQEAIDFFSLDRSERRLLDSLDPEVAVARTIDASGGDSLEAWQLVCMLKLAELAEFGTAPFSPAPEPERSGVRATSHVTGGGSYSAGGVEERVFSPGRARPTPRQAPSQAASPVQPRGAAQEASSPQGAQGNDAGNGARRRFGSAIQRAAAPPKAMPLATPQEPSSAKPAEAPPSSNKPRPRRPVRKLNRNLKRLDNELRSRAVSMQPGAGISAAPRSAPQERSHVKQLLMRRRMRTQQASQDEQRAVDAAASFKQVQALLRTQKFGAAKRKMLEICKEQPDNEIYEIYRLWATFRAENGLPDEDGSRLRTLLRQRLNDDQYAGFAYYVLGMLALPSGKDSYAEKCFRKALLLDAKNKDAERHLRLIEVRRKTASQGNGQKIFGIEIGGRKS